MSLLQVRDLTVDFDLREAAKFRALDGISFDVGPGESVGLLGESGSGKTTIALSLLRVLPRAGHIVSGSIRFRERELLELHERQLQKVRGAELSIIFQESEIALNPVMCVGQQIAEVIRAHRPWRGGRCRAEAQSVLDQVNLEGAHIYSAYPHQLSGGQRQRVGIALALALKPALVIADEPTAALDAATQAEVLALLAELKQRFQIALLFISHNPALIAQLADRILVMRDGRIIEEGANLLRSVALPRKQRPAENEQPDLLVRIQNLNKTYRRRGWFSKQRSAIMALRHVDLTIAEGVTLALVGQSGSGKSTLARCIASLEKPDSGEIWFEDTNLLTLTTGQLAARRARIQLIFQDPAATLNPRMPAVELIAEPLAIQNRGTKRERRQRALELMEQVKLSPESGDKLPMEFSGGQRQRLAIARALALQPKLLILDEAFSGLDLPIRAQIISLLVELQSLHNLTYLYISHDLTFVYQIADEVAVLFEGEIVERAETGQLFTSPRHSHTRTLLAATPGLPEMHSPGGFDNSC